MNYCKQYAGFYGIPKNHAHMYHAIKYGRIKRSFNNMEDLFKYVSQSKDVLSIYIPSNTDPCEDYDLEEYNPLSMDDKIYHRRESLPVSSPQYNEISTPLEEISTPLDEIKTNKYEEYVSKIKSITKTVFYTIIDTIDYLLFED
jgi:hypothetical protein